MPFTEKSMEYIADKKGESDRSGDVDEMVLDWRMNENLQLEMKTVKDGWIDDELDEAPKNLENTIKEQKVKDDLYQVDYKNVDKNGVEDAFVIPFGEPLGDCIVEPVFEKDSTSYAEKIEEQSGKPLNELIKTELVTDGNSVYEKRGISYFIKKLNRKIKRHNTQVLLVLNIEGLIVTLFTYLCTLLVEDAAIFKYLFALSVILCILVNIVIIILSLKKIDYKRYERLF